MVPKTLFKDWAQATFKSATDYWTFRKMLTLQLSLAGFAEYVLHLSRYAVCKTLHRIILFSTVP